MSSSQPEMTLESILPIAVNMMSGFSFKLCHIIVRYQVELMFPVGEHISD